MSCDFTNTKRDFDPSLSKDPQLGFAAPFSTPPDL